MFDPAGMNPTFIHVARMTGTACEGILQSTEGSMLSLEFALNPEPSHQQPVILLKAKKRSLVV